MYSYYGLAAIGPHLQPYLWWKKYITKLQLTQFVLVMTHCFQLLFRDCDYPRIFMVYIGFYAVLFLFMFSDFYFKAYTSSSRSSKVSRKVDQVPSDGESVSSSSKIVASNNNACLVMKNGHIQSASEMDCKKLL